MLLLVTMGWIESPRSEAAIRINEFVASNSQGITDEDGEHSDWIELSNAGPDPVGLMGFGLTDDPRNPFKWVVPDLTLAPGEHLVIFASGKDRRPSG